MKDRIVFDPSYANETDNVGAYVRAGTDGTQISWTANVNAPATQIVQDLTYTAACTDFDAGNSITITYVDPAAPSQALSVSVLGQAITVNLATDGASTLISTAADIAAAIQASLAASELVNVAITGTGSTVQTAWAVAPLAGGTLKQALDVHVMGSPHNGQYHEDCQHTSGDKGQMILGVRHDADTSMVSHNGDYAPLQLSATGRLKVDAELDVDFDYVYAEDSASADGNLGAYILSVRSDTLTSTTSTNGDFQSFKTDDLGALWVHVSEQDVDNTLANLNVPVGLSAVPLTAALASRRRIIIQNVDTSKSFYVGTASVTVANGFRISPGSGLELALAAGTTIYGIAGFAGVQSRVLETGFA